MNKKLKTLSARLLEVEKASRQSNDTHHDHKIHLDGLSAKIKNIQEKLKSNTENINKKLAEQKKDIDKATNIVKGESSKFKEELIDLKLDAMKDTLIFYNIPEVEGENCADKIAQYCENSLKIEGASTNTKIERANRMGKQGENIRPIIAKFSDISQRQEIRKNASKLKGTNFGISEQLPGEIMKRRKTLLPKLRELRDKDVKAYFVRDKIYVKGIC